MYTRYSYFIEKNIKDKKISFSIMAIFLVLIVQLFVLNLFEISGTSTGSVIQLLSKIIIAFLFIRALHILIIREFSFIFLTYAVALVAILFNFLIYPQNIGIIKSILFDFFGICLLCFIYAFSIDDTSILMNIYMRVSLIIFFIGILIGILVLAKVISLGTYSMPYSYYMLIPAISFLKKFLEKINLKNFISFFITLIIILVFGSRGAVVCIAVYFILFIFINFDKKRKIAILVSFSISAILLWIFKNIVNNLIVNLISFFGIKSRTLTIFLNNIFYTSGRENIYNSINELIAQNPLIGIGMAGDRLYLGSYSHNIFLEIISGFGIIMGTMILMLLIIMIFISLFTQNKEKANVNLIWFSIGFIPLLFSGSYLTYFSFWIYLGIALKSMISYKNNKNILSY